MRENDIQSLLNGKWIGDWGNHKDVIIEIMVTENHISGSYILNNQSIPFTGSIKVSAKRANFTFNPPMEAQSGGYLDIQSKRLFLHCTSSNGCFRKIESHS